MADGEPWMSACATLWWHCRSNWWTCATTADGEPWMSACATQIGIHNPYLLLTLTPNISARTVNVFKTRLDHHLRNVRGIYKRLLFSPADGHPWRYLHGWILVILVGCVALCYDGKLKLSTQCWAVLVQWRIQGATGGHGPPNNGQIFFTLSNRNHR